jgi:hypothetical protein
MLCRPCLRRAAHRRQLRERTAVSEQPTQAPEAEWHASWYGMQVYFNPAIPPGSVRLYDRNGKLLGRFDDVARVEVAGRT